MVAYVLIQTRVGKPAEVAREIASIDGVDAAEQVTGPYDVIVRAEARNLEELGRRILVRIEQVEGITRTSTCPVVHFESRAGRSASWRWDSNPRPSDYKSLALPDCATPACLSVAAAPARSRIAGIATRKEPPWRCSSRSTWKASRESPRCARSIAAPTIFLGLESS